MKKLQSCRNSLENRTDGFVGILCATYTQKKKKKCEATVKIAQGGK